MVDTRIHPLRITIIILLFMAFLSASPYPASAQQQPQEPPSLDPESVHLQNELVLPLVINPPESTIDLTIASLEVTQAVQTETNSVPLVAGRDTMVRVYAQTGQNIPSDGISVSLSAKQNGEHLPGSPLLSQPIAVLPNPSRAVLNSSHNFIIPQTWTSGQVVLEANVDAGGAVVEIDETNNVFTAALEFIPVPELDLKIVPIDYYHDTGSDFIYYPATSLDNISADILRMYPLHDVNVSFHSPIIFYGDLRDKDDWSYLLNNLTNIKISEGAPDSQVWYAPIPIEDSAGNTWHYGGIAGLGWIGYRVSVGLDKSILYEIDGGNIAAHEIGHNLGRRHSPCGVNEFDPNYPYPDGIIGHFGMDVSQLSIVQDTTKDIMSYCTPNWVSDYTYSALLYDQQQYGNLSSQSESEKVLLVRAFAGQDGQVELKPIYDYEGVTTKDTHDSALTIEVLDENGELLAAHPAQVLRAEEPGYSTWAVNTSIPSHGENAASIRLIEDGTVLLEGQVTKNKSAYNASKAADSSDEHPAAQIVLINDSHHLTWDQADIPAMVRVKSVNNQTWTTLGIDIMGGGLPFYPQYLPPGELEFEITFAGGQYDDIHLDWIN